MWKNLYVENTLGSENGLILKDEEYADSCRVTLEKCKKYYAITCGVYGAMCHTAFCNADKYEKMYDAVKSDLQEFVDRKTTEEEELQFYHDFTNKY